MYSQKGKFIDISTYSVKYFFFYIELDSTDAFHSLFENLLSFFASVYLLICKVKWHFEDQNSIIMILSLVQFSSIKYYRLQLDLL